MPSCPTIRPAIPRTQHVIRRPAEGSPISPNLRPENRTDNLQWYRAIHEYDAWETDGIRREFGYLAVNFGDICFSKTLEHSAHQASRFGVYRWVVSYRGAGWVPSALLEACDPPLPPLIYYSGHMIEQGRERLLRIHRMDASRDHELLDRVDDLMASPRTQLIATWNRPPDGGPIEAQLWHRHPHGTLVAHQLQGEHPRSHDIRCITFLAPHMHPHDNRFRVPGTMTISLDEYNRLGRPGQITVLNQVD